MHPGRANPFLARTGRERELLRCKKDTTHSRCASMGIKPLLLRTRSPSCSETSSDYWADACFVFNSMRSC